MLFQNRPYSRVIFECGTVLPCLSSVIDFQVQSLLCSKYCSNCEILIILSQNQGKHTKEKHSLVAFPPAWQVTRGVMSMGHSYCVGLSGGGLIRDNLANNVCQMCVCLSLHPLEVQKVVNPVILDDIKNIQNQGLAENISKTQKKHMVLPL